MTVEFTPKTTEPLLLEACANLVQINWGRGFSENIDVKYLAGDGTTCPAIETKTPNLSEGYYACSNGGKEKKAKNSTGFTVCCKFKMKFYFDTNFYILL